MSVSPTLIDGGHTGENLSGGPAAIDRMKINAAGEPDFAVDNHNLAVITMVCLQETSTEQMDWIEFEKGDSLFACRLKNVAGVALEPTLS